MSTHSLSKLIRGREDTLVASLRIALSIIFVWFGALKMAGYNPVFDLIYHSAMPVLAAGSGLWFLGLFEVVVGLLLFTNKWLDITHVILLFHLLGTFSTFVYGWHVIFDPVFPVLSLQGEFVVKNIVLVIAGLVVLAHESKKKRARN